jgi:Fe-S cluster biogenesis protein NfuA
MNDLHKRVEKALEFCRPFLKVDEGDIELVSIDEAAGIADIRFLGACATCPLKLMTLRAGIERAIIFEAPEIKRIEEIV